MEKKESRLKEVEELKGKTKAMEVELAAARKERDEETTINRMFWYFIKNLGDVVNKVKLYDKGMSRPGASPEPKLVRFLVDYNTKMEKMLKEMRALLQLEATQHQPASP